MADPVIFKFPLAGFDELSDELTLEMTAGQVIFAGYDPTGALCVWALADLDEPYVDRTFLVRGTGMKVPEGAAHVVSWVHGPFVWHLFELSES